MLRSGSNRRQRRIHYIAYFRYGGTVIERRYGLTNGTIWLANVHCIGNEASIAHCYHDWGFNNTYCDHSKDVSVSCGSYPVQFGNDISNH